MRPLAGLRVVDLTMWVLGPAAGAVLGDWGAEVIKIEPPQGGDPVRGLLAHGIAPAAGYNYLHELCNRSKRSLALDVRHPEGKRVALRLIERADVFVTNLRQAALERMGLDYLSLSIINPRLIYAHASGYGPEGPERNKQSFDELGFWARSGIMSVLGEPDMPPPPLHGAIGDLTTAITLAGGVMLALYTRERTGKGMEVSASLLASGMWAAGMDIQASLASGKDIPRVSRNAQANPLYNTYPTRDGWLQFVMPQTDRYWDDLCRALGLEALAVDPRYDSHDKRCQHSQELIPLLESTLLGRTTEEWKQRLARYDLAWEAMNTCAQVIQDPQAVSNSYIVEADHPALGRVRHVASPLQLDRSSFTPVRPAPELGQHTDEILLELGYTRKEISSLKGAGVTL